MRILIANDDGIQSTGLWALARALAPDHEVAIAAPAREQSGTGHGFTFGRPLAVVEKHVDGFVAWEVDGLPADCVKFALFQGMAEHPDLVLSGINLGENAGVCQPYSGTVACAREAALIGRPAIALSCQGTSEDQLEGAARWVARLLAAPLPPFGAGVFWNVNFPDRDPATWRETRLCTSSRAMFRDRYVPVGPGLWQLMGHKDAADIVPDTDDAWLFEGHPVVAPLNADSTDRTALEALRGWTLPLLDSSRQESP